MGGAGVDRHRRGGASWVQRCGGHHQQLAVRPYGRESAPSLPSGMGAHRAFNRPQDSAYRLVRLALNSCLPHSYAHPISSALAYPPKHPHKQSGTPPTRPSCAMRPAECQWPSQALLACSSCCTGAARPPGRAVCAGGGGNCCCRPCPGSTQRQARQAAFGGGGDDGGGCGRSAVMSGLVGARRLHPTLARSRQHTSCSTDHCRTAVARPWPGVLHRSRQRLVLAAGQVHGPVTHTNMHAPTMPAAAPAAVPATVPTAAPAPPSPPAVSQPPPSAAVQPYA